MKNSSYNNLIQLFWGIFLISLCLTGCKKEDNPIKFPKGAFPDSVIVLANINSAFDDYNLSLPQLTGTGPVVFSSNRASSGGQFDLEQANISFVFDQTNGSFTLKAEMTNDAFLTKLIAKAKTPGNDFGPYRMWSSVDGLEFLLLSSINGAGNLDLFYLKNPPIFNNILPDIDGPYPVTLLNSSFDDAYICFDTNLDSAYFSSNREGNFDIFLQVRPQDKELAWWFSQGYSVSTKVDVLNSSGNDKCPMFFRNIMIFTSDRPGGLGGLDLYYSVLKKGVWSSPVNLGPGINSSADEYRPVIGFHPDFTNMFLMFSSDRPGGKGGFDLYFAGIEYPE